MKSFVVEFVRPDGTPVRFIDAGFEFVESAGTPLANVERPIRVESDRPASLLQNAFQVIPLPDGPATTLRVIGNNVPLATNTTTQRAIVVLDGTKYELKVSLTTQLNKLEERTNLMPPAFRDSEQAAPDTAGSPPPPESTQRNLSLKCPRCGSDLRMVRFPLGNSFKEFLGCSAYPRCRYGRND